MMINTEVQINLRSLKRTDSSLMASECAKNIREAVEAGATSWEELGITDDDITRLVLEAQEREKKK